jgi:hypothetical protein
MSSRLFERTPDTSHTFGHIPPMTSAKLLCTVVPPPFEVSVSSLVLSPSPSTPLPGIPVRPAPQPRANLRARRQQRYSRDESALTVALKRPADYERVIPSKPPMQYATIQLEARINDAKARLVDVRELLRDDTIDQVTHHTLLHTRWMAERWIATAEKEHSRANALTGHLISEVTRPPARKTRRDANLAYFFTHSPTRTTTLSAQLGASGLMEQPRGTSKHNVESLRLRKWPLTTTLREPMNLKTFPATASYDNNSKLSGSSLLPHDPLSPKLPHSHESNMSSPLSEQSSLPAVSTASTFSTIPATPVDDSSNRIWPGFAVIHVPPQPSDEELLAALSADVKAEPIPEYVTYLLDRLETIGEDVILPRLSRKGSTASTAFELISRPSIEVYDYPILPRPRLFVGRSMRVYPPTRPGMGILSGRRAASEEPSPPTSPHIQPTMQGHESPRSSVLSRVRRSITARGHQ